MTETVEHYHLIDDDPDFGMKAGDVLACIPYWLDPDKLTVAFRVSDGYDPSCNVYRSQVKRVDGATDIRWLPDGAVPADSVISGETVGPAVTA